MKRFAVRAALLVLIVAMTTTPGMTVGSRPGHAQWEANVSNYRDGQDGEPSVAVNPRNPNNVIITYLETGGALGALIYQQRTPRVQDEVVQTIQSCRYVVTHDG